MLMRTTPCIAQLLAFEYGSAILDAADTAASDAFAGHLLHLLSLLHALALQHLRRDWELDNLCTHTRGLPPPPAVRTEQTRASVMTMQTVDAQPSGSIMAPLSYRHMEKRTSTRPLQVAGGPVGCLHMRDFASLRSTAAQRAAHHQAMPLDVLGGLSGTERRALGAHSVQSTTHTPSASRPRVKSDVEQGKLDTGCVDVLSIHV